MWASPTVGQMVRGTVIDVTTDRPIPFASLALVTVDGQARRATSSDSAGRFELLAPSVGRYSIAAERIGYRSVTTPPFDLAVVDTLAVIVRLHVDAVELAPLEVVSERPPLTLDTRLLNWGFYGRRDRFGLERGTGVAHFMEFGEIQRRNAQRPSDLFRQMSGVYVVSRGGARGAAVLGRRRCRMTLFLDGAIFGLGVDSIDDVVAVGSISAIEVYPRAPWPAQYAPRDPTCGSIVVWTGWVEGKGR